GHHTCASTGFTDGRHAIVEFTRRLGSGRFTTWEGQLYDYVKRPQRLGQPDAFGFCPGDGRRQNSRRLPANIALLSISRTEFASDALDCQAVFAMRLIRRLWRRSSSECGWTGRALAGERILGGAESRSLQGRDLTISIGAMQADGSCAPSLGLPAEPNVSRAQDLAALTSGKDPRTKQRVVQLLLYTGQAATLLPTISQWWPPKFPVNGHSILSNWRLSIAGKGPILGQIIDLLRLEWRDSRYTADEATLLREEVRVRVLTQLGQSTVKRSNDSFGDATCDTIDRSDKNKEENQK
uniref:DUF222 domain-containing protein n=1 Tax=Macrostomum lignano TaxID=282301 RepID=A0A1I8JNE2_9PLAT